MNGFRMQAEGGKGEIWIFGLIGSFFFEDGVSSDEFVQELRDLGDISELVVHINSPGGHVHEGQAIYNALKEHPANIITSIEGAAWSAASMIAMAGDTIRMHANSTLMIHEPLGGGWGFAADMRKIADGLEQLTGIVLDVYVARSGADRDQVAAWMKEEKSFTAQQAKDAGFADEIVANKKSKSAAASRPAVNWSQHLKTLGVRGLPQVALALSKSLKTEPDPMADTNAPAATADQNPSTPAPPAAAPASPPAAPVAAAAAVVGTLAAAVDKQPSADDVRAAERKRISGVTAVCEMAKVPAGTRQKWIDEGLSVEDVTLEARKQMAASNPAPEAAGGQPDSDPNAKYREEFRKRNPKMVAMCDLSEDEYVASRRVDDGLEPLVPGKPLPAKK